MYVEGPEPHLTIFFSPSPYSCPWKGLMNPWDRQSTTALLKNIFLLPLDSYFITVSNIHSFIHSFSKYLLRQTMTPWHLVMYGLTIIPNYFGIFSLNVHLSIDCGFSLDPLILHRTQNIIPVWFPIYPQVSAQMPSYLRGPCWPSKLKSCLFHPVSLCALSLLYIFPITLVTIW